MADAFNKPQSRITVRVIPVPDAQFVTKLATAIRGGRVPDLVDFDDINSTLFAYHGAFADLTDLIAELPGSDNLSPRHLALATKDGRHYAVPFLADNSVLFCNTELFERAGLDLDDPHPGLRRAAGSRAEDHRPRWRARLDLSGQQRRRLGLHRATAHLGGRNRPDQG